LLSLDLKPATESLFKTVFGTGSADCRCRASKSSRGSNDASCRPNYDECLLKSFDGTFIKYIKLTYANGPSRLSTHSWLYNGLLSYDPSSPPLTIACSFCLRAVSSCDWSVYQGAIKFSRSAADDRGRTKCREIDIAGLCSGLLIKYA